jgi:dTDP-4-dehydrorhamnose 3,5-epimerase-like enzyme
MTLINWIPVTELGDLRGSLVSFEGAKTVPFHIERVYCVFETKKGVSRGFHAHKKLKQLIVCITGKCRIVLDNGTIREDVWLDSPANGLLVEDMIWREMHDFSDDCVLVVIADQHYDETDYIRDYQEFIRQVRDE